MADMPQWWMRGDWFDVWQLQHPLSVRVRTATHQ